MLGLVVLLAVLPAIRLVVLLAIRLVVALVDIIFNFIDFESFFNPIVNNYHIFLITITFNKFESYCGRKFNVGSNYKYDADIISITPTSY